MSDQNLQDSDLAETHRVHIWNRRFNTIYRVRLSILYHLKRERFFDGVDKFVSMVTAATATAAVAVILKQQDKVDVTTAAITAALSLVPLVYNPAQKAREHGQAASEFRRLLADCERAGEYWDESICNNMAARVVELEATEPAPMGALLADCQNQLAIAHGQPAPAKLTVFEKMFKNWFMFDASKISARGNATI